MQNTPPHQVARAAVLREDFQGSDHPNGFFHSDAGEDEDHRPEWRHGCSVAQHRDEVSSPHEGAEGRRRPGRSRRQLLRPQARSRQLRQAPGVPQAQRVHRRLLPQRVAGQGGAPQRLLHPQRDHQRLDASDRLLRLPRAHRVRRHDGPDGVRGVSLPPCGAVLGPVQRHRQHDGAQELRRRRSGRRGNEGDAAQQQRVRGSRARAAVVGEAPRRAVAVLRVPLRRHVLPADEQRVPPAGLPLGARQLRAPPPRLRRHHGAHRHLLLPARLLHLPLRPPVPGALPRLHHRLRRRRRGGLAAPRVRAAGAAVGAGGALRVHGHVGPGAHRAQDAGVRGPAGGRGDDGVRDGHGRRVPGRRGGVRHQGPRAVDARAVRPRGTQPPALPRARRRRRLRALPRRPGLPQLEGHGRVLRRAGLPDLRATRASCRNLTGFTPHLTRCRLILFSDLVVFLFCFFYKK